MKATSGVHSVKNRRPRHDPLHPCIYNLPKVFLGCATVDLDRELQSPFLAPGGQLPHLAQCVGNELLPAETGIHAHHQDVVGDVQYIVQHGHRGSGIDHDPRLGPFAADHPQGPVQMLTGFLVNGNLVGPGGDEDGRVLVRILDHQVHVQDRAGGLAERFDHRRSDGEIGHEMAVHHVHMEHAAAGRLERGNLLAQARKIGRKDGWQDLNHERYPRL